MEISLEQPKRVLMEGLCSHQESKSNVIQVCGNHMGYLCWALLNMNIRQLSLVFPFLCSKVLIFFKKNPLNTSFDSACLYKRNYQKQFFCYFLYFSISGMKDKYCELAWQPETCVFFLPEFQHWICSQWAFF